MSQKKVFTIPVEWDMHGCLKIEADTLEEALSMVEADIETPETLFGLLSEQFCFEGSFKISDISNEEIMEMYNGDEQ